ncbi:MAG: hypothetical protein Q4B54_03175, partial [Coriobacteriales bacterium]|nr:hypothetical protein [Coriobacteriales bacterium]
MLSAQMILNYWSDATKLGSEPDASLAKKTRHWEASIQEVRAGVLNPETTRALFSAYSADFPHIDYGKRNVPVVLSLKTLVPAKDEAAKDPAVPGRPLLLLRAQVRANG